MWARVYSGKYTFFGKAADMINSVEVVGRFQKIVFGITMWLLAASIALTIIIFVRLEWTMLCLWPCSCADKHVFVFHCPLWFCVMPQIKLMVSASMPTTYTVDKYPGYTPPSQFISAISNCIVILVASIPIAIEIVCTSTLAVGSRRLAESKVIVARLSAIEELAGMTILCSDKTGTMHACVVSRALCPPPRLSFPPVPFVTGLCV